MKFISRLMLCLMISFSLIETPMINSAQAGMISTNEVVEVLTRSETEQKVVKFIERSEVQEQMMKLGVSAEEASVRVAHLSDSELSQISAEIDQSTAGGDVGGILVLVLVVVLIIYLIKRI